MGRGTLDDEGWTGVKNGERRGAGNMRQKTGARYGGTGYEER